MESLGLHVVMRQKAHVGWSEIYIEREWRREMGRKVN